MNRRDFLKRMLAAGLLVPSTRTIIDMGANLYRYRLPLEIALPLCELERIYRCGGFDAVEYKYFPNESSSSSIVPIEGTWRITEYGPSLRDLATIVEMDFCLPPMSELPISVKDGSYLPTLTASEGGYNKSVNSKNPRGSLTTLVRQQHGLMLSPRFAEWFMGYEVGWTELEPWAMELSRHKQGKLLRL